MASCGVKLAYHANGELFEKSLGGEASMQVISALLYADDMVLMSCDRAELECMLQVMDAMCNKMGMCINASKTELMAFDPASPEALPPGVMLSGGLAKYVSVFKYLGDMVNTACDCDVEVRAAGSTSSSRSA